MRVFGGPGQNRGLVESEKWVFVCVVDVNGLTFVVGSNGGLEAIPTHSLARVRTPQTAAAIDGSRPVHGGATKQGSFLAKNRVNRVAYIRHL